MKNNRLFRYCIFLMSILWSCDLVSGAENPIRALILSGQNNHNWRATTPFIQNILTDYGIDTAICDRPDQMTRELLSKYDVIVSNWTNWGVSQNPWPEETRQAFLDFISNGGGHITVHAGGSSFNDWQEYHKIVASWGQNTGHNAISEFVVDTVDANHPVSQGIFSFYTRDELWYNTSFPAGSKVLMQSYSSRQTGGTGQFEPVLTVCDYGSGKCVNLMLGHDVAAMSNPGFELLLVRSVQWAADYSELSSVPDYLPRNNIAAKAIGISLEQALEDCKKYEFGGELQSLYIMQEKVNAVQSSQKDSEIIAEKIAEVLVDDVSVDCKVFLCQLLQQIGTDKQVEVLEKLLTDNNLSMYAIGALEMIKTEKSLQALLDALASVSDNTKLELFASLGNINNEKAVKYIKEYLNSDISAIKYGAINALGRIYCVEALNALLQLDNEDELVAQSIINCGYGLMQCGYSIEAGEAFKIYTKKLPDNLRWSAFVGYLQSTSFNRHQIIMQTLESKDSVLESAALYVTKLASDKENIAHLAAKMNGFSQNAQIFIIHLVMDLKLVETREYIAKAIDSASPAVRIAALQALGSIGDVSTLDMLLDRYILASAQEKTIIHSSLLNLPDSSALQDYLVDLLNSANPETSLAVINVVKDRQITKSVKSLLELSKSDKAEVVNNCVLALGVLADISVFPELIALLNQEQPLLSDSVLERALISIGRRTEQWQSNSIIGLLPGANIRTKIVLLKVLGNVADQQALDLLRIACDSEDGQIRLEALRVLSNWKDISALETIVAMLEQEEDYRLRTLLFRGAMRLLASEQAINNAESVIVFNNLCKNAKSNQEQEMFLALAVHYPSKTTLNWLFECMSQPDLLEKSAETAITTIKAIDSHDLKLVALKKLMAMDVSSKIKSEAARQLYLLSNVENLARKGTAQSLGGWQADGNAQGPQAAIDDDINTYWDETDNQKEYVLRIILKHQQDIQAISIMGYQHHNFSPKDFDIIVDGKLIKSITDAQYSENILFIFLPDVKGKVVDLKIKGYYGNSPAIRELEIYGKIQ